MTGHMRLGYQLRPCERCGHETVHKYCTWCRRELGPRKTMHPRPQRLDHATNPAARRKMRDGEQRMRHEEEQRASLLRGWYETG